MKVVIGFLLCCIAFVNVHGTSAPEFPPEQIRRCRLPPVTGPCRASMTKFYYDPGTNSCKNFIYGGCEGNNNRFNTEAECQTTCGFMSTQRPCPGAGLSGPVPECTPYFYNDQTDGCLRVQYNCPGKQPQPGTQCPPMPSIRAEPGCKPSADLRDVAGCPYVVVDCANRVIPGQS